MDVKKLFKGIAVIVDDEIGKPDSSIVQIRKHIESQNIPVATYEEIPNCDIIPSLSNAAFVILDWEYKNGTLAIDISSGERVTFASSELQTSQKEKLIEFLKKLIDQTFVPVFIFTLHSEDSIKSSLQDNGLWIDNKPNRIFIKRKNDIDTSEKLFSEIENWLKEMPSVYVFKEWEKVVSKNKDEMFLELYKFSPNWVKVIWDMLKEDVEKEFIYEFGTFITRTLNNRITSYSFDETFIKNDTKVEPKELLQVLEGERYFRYREQPQQAYTGDLFKKGKKYYLNIRAQCDLSREEDPVLYCIEGEKLGRNRIVKDHIKMTPEGKITFGDESSFLLTEILPMFGDEGKIEDLNSKLEELNKKFRKHRDSVFYRKGSFLERNDKVIISCVNGEEVIEFGLGICLIKFKDFKEKEIKRIGRILPPFITRIQQKCAQNLVREGITPVPEKLFCQ